MIGAELKTLRESLGLPLQWVADQASVKVRSAQYWESGQRTIPQDVAHMLRNIETRVREAVAAATDNLKSTLQGSGVAPGQIALVRYRTDADLWRYQPSFKPLPATCHGAMLALLAREIEALGIPVSIVYMQPEEYEAWLDGREDSDAMREAWAGMAREMQAKPAWMSKKSTT